MNNNIEYKFKNIEVWPDDDGQEMILCVVYEMVEKSKCVVYAVSVSREDYSSLNYMNKFRKEFSNLDIVDCIKKLLVKYPSSTEDILMHIPMSIFSKSEKMKEIFEVVANNDEQIKIAKNVIETRIPYKRSTTEKYIEMIDFYNQYFMV